jgi:membrane protein implicated in regulation of membrane protease activity
VAGIAAMGVAAVLGMVMDLNNTAIFTSSCVAYVAVSMWTESRIARYRNREQPISEQLVGEQGVDEQRVSEQRVSEQHPLESRGGEHPGGDQRPRGEGNAA